MAVIKNTSGYNNSKRLISSGNYNTGTDWSFSSSDGNKLLGSEGDDWSEYKKWFLAEDTSSADETKERWKYPFGKNGNVYRSALTAIRQRSAQQDETDIFNAAGDLIELIDGKEKDKSILSNLLISIKNLTRI